jgi:hypothetical protein
VNPITLEGTAAALPGAGYYQLFYNPTTRLIAYGN